MDDFVESAVAAPVETVAFDAPAAGFNGSGAVGHRVALLGGEPFQVAGLSQDLRSRDLSDTADLSESCLRCLHGLADLAFRGFDLAVQAAYVRYTRTRYARAGAFVASVAALLRRRVLWRWSATSVCCGTRSGFSSGRCAGG